VEEFTRPVEGLAELQALERELLDTVGFHDPRRRAIGDAIHGIMAAVGSHEEAEKRARRLDGSESFVCYLDVDGFRARVAEDAAGLFEGYSRLRQYMLGTFFRVSTQSAGGAVVVEHSGHLLWPVAFSDSWFFASVDASEESLRQVSSAAAGMFMRFMELGLVARGGIGLGRTWWDPTEQVFLGTGVTEAYEVAERLDCFGVVAHESVAAIAPDDALTRGLPVALKSGPPSDVSDSGSARFAKLYARSTNRRFNTTSYRAKFRTLMQQYEATPSAKSTVVTRYERSLAIVDAMLEAVDDEPGLNE
jgi:hypothetical protein